MSAARSPWRRASLDIILCLSGIPWWAAAGVGPRHGRFPSRCARFGLTCPPTHRFGRGVDFGRAATLALHGPGWHGASRRLFYLRMLVVALMNVIRLWSSTYFVYAWLTSTESAFLVIGRVLVAVLACMLPMAITTSLRYSESTILLASGGGSEGVSSQPASTSAAITTRVREPAGSTNPLVVAQFDGVTSASLAEAQAMGDASCVSCLADALPAAVLVTVLVVTLALVSTAIATLFWFQPRLGLLVSGFLLSLVMPFVSVTCLAAGISSSVRTRAAHFLLEFYHEPDNTKVDPARRGMGGGAGAQMHECSARATCEDNPGWGSGVGDELAVGDRAQRIRRAYLALLSLVNAVNRHWSPPLSLFAMACVGYACSMLLTLYAVSFRTASASTQELVTSTGGLLVLLLCFALTIGSALHSSITAGAALQRKLLRDASLTPEQTQALSWMVDASPIAVRILTPITKVVMTRVLVSSAMAAAPAIVKLLLSSV